MIRDTSRRPICMLELEHGFEIRKDPRARSRNLGYAGELHEQMGGYQKMPDVSDDRRCYPLDSRARRLHRKIIRRPPGTITMARGLEQLSMATEVVLALEKR